LQELFSDNENKKKFLDQLIEEEVIYQLAKKDRIESSDEFKEKVSDLKRQLIINLFIQKNVDGVSEVTKVEVENYYTQNSNQFNEYEARNLSHILVKTSQEASDVLTQLNRTGQFDQLAARFSIDETKNKGGYLGWVKKESLVPDFANAAFSLKGKGSVSSIIQTKFGFHIIKLNEDPRVVPARSLQDVYSDISKQLLDFKKREAYNELLTNGKELVTIEKNTDNF
jgi:Parvulin-like peptidyl-prolyl isomerase